MRTTIRSLTLLAAACAALGSTSASADDWNLLLNGKAFHVDATKDWNENNLGLGVEREFGSDSRWVKLAMFNGYRDSDQHMAYMAGGGVKRRFRLEGLAPEWHVDVGVVGFLMTREDVDDNRRFPGALPVVSVGNRHMAVNMTYMPTSFVERTVPLRMNDPTVDGVFFVQFSFDTGLFRLGRERRALLAASPDE